MSWAVLSLVGKGSCLEEEEVFLKGLVKDGDIFCFELLLVRCCVPDVCKAWGLGR